MISSLKWSQYDGASLPRTIVMEFFKKFMHHCLFCFLTFNWDSLHKRLSSYFKAWSTRKRRRQGRKAYRKVDYKEPTDNRCLVTLDQLNLNWCLSILSKNIHDSVPKGNWNMTWSISFRIHHLRKMTFESYICSFTIFPNSFIFFP